MAVRDLTAKERILLHLFEFYRLADEYTVPEGVTQSGIAKGVGIRVQHATQNLQPMIKDGMVEEHTRHIDQKQRRRKAYFLTTRGVHQAASLRKSLFDEVVPFGSSAATAEEVPLSRVYQEERRETPLPALLVELKTMGFVRAEPGPSSLEVVDFSHEAPTVDRFYGRERELSRVLEALQGAFPVIVTGMAGIGKTTLGSIVCDRLRGTRSLYWRRVRPWDQALDLATRLAGFLSALGRPRLNAHLSTVGETQLGRIEEILADDLSDLDAVLIFDDVHGAREDALDFISLLYQVLGRPDTCPGILLSRTVPRFHGRREVVVEKSAVELTLAGLEDEPARQMLSDARVPEPLWSELIDLSGANPLFLKVLTRGGAVKDLDRAWRTLEVYIADEIEPALSEEERTCLEYGSFYVGPVPAEGFLLGSQGGTRSLVALRAKGLLDPVGVDRFLLHDSLRDYFQRGLPLERRQAISERVLSWLSSQAEEAEQRGELGDAISLLENVLTYESDPASQIPSLRRLGRLRTTTGDASGGLEAYLAALELTEDDIEKISLLEQIASGFSELGRFDEAEEQIEQAMELLPEGPTAETTRLLLKSITAIHLIRLDYPRAWECADRAASWMATLEGEPYLEGLLAQIRGWLFAVDPERRDFARAAEELRRAEEIWKKVSPRTLLWTYSTHMRLALTDGRADDALAYADRLIDLSTQNGDVISRFDGMRWKAVCLYLQFGQFEEGLALLGELHELADTIQLPWPGYPLWDEISIYELQGRYAEAREALTHWIREGPRDVWAPIFSDEGYVRWAESKIPVGMINYTWMAQLSAKLRDDRAAEDAIREAEKRAPENPSSWQRSQLEIARALLHESRGEAEKADLRYQNMVGHFEDMKCMEEPMIFPVMACKYTIEACLMDYAEFLTRQDRKEEAEALLARIIQKTSSYGMKALERLARDILNGLSSGEYPRWTWDR